MYFIRLSNHSVVQQKFNTYTDNRIPVRDFYFSLVHESMLTKSVYYQKSFQNIATLHFLLLWSRETNTDD